MRVQLKAHSNLLWITAIFLLFSLVAHLVNNTYYHYIGNYYFSNNTPWFFLILALIYMGFRLQCGKDNKNTLKVREIFFFFSTYALLVVGGNAIQLTPFEPIDAQIIDWHAWTHIDLTTLMQWSHLHPKAIEIMDALYRSLAKEMTYLPVVLILLGELRRVREYCFLVIITALIGYAFYYFFPTTAPASVLQSPYFTEEQYATGLKFYQIHQHMVPTTIDGGMIALPSFHVVWAWLCVYLVRGWPIICATLGLVNLVIVCSCVLLGWHYLLDVIASIAVIGLGHFIYLKCYPPTYDTLTVHTTTGTP